MQKSFLKSRWFWYWLGIFGITLLFYVFIGRFPGYIYYWDASGAFSLRDPWQQYVTTYSPYDGIEVGLKNRLPIVSVIWLLTQILSVFGGSQGELAMKVAMWLVFVLAFTSIYWLLPKFIKFFIQDDENFPGEKSGLLPFVLALIYLILPFYTYRIVHLHLFYFTAFYPLFCYCFLKLLEAQADWKRFASVLVITSFFGLTSPHAIVYVLLTYFILGISWIYKKSIKEVVVKFGQLVVTAVGVLIVNLFWIIPYILEKAPSPGYMVNTDMYSYLGVNTSFLNFIFDISEWFIAKSGELSGFFAQGSLLRSLQYVGVFFFYALLLYFIVKNKPTKFSVGAIVILVLCILFAVKESPLQSLITNNIIFSSFGWVLREPNRIKFIFMFWAYLFFSFGFAQYLKKLLVEKNALVRLLTIIIFSAGITTYLLYLVPRFIQVAEYLHPTVFPNEVTQIQKEVSKNGNWGNLLFYPREEGGYGLSWKPSTFALADENDYLSLGYQLSAPPTRNSSVLASNRSVADLVGSRFIDGSLVLDHEVLLSEGIQYILIDKHPRPLYTWIPTIDEIIKERDDILKKTSGITLLKDNPRYTLYQLKNFSDLVTYSRRIYTADDLTILEHLDISKNVEVEFVTRPEARLPDVPGQLIVAYKDAPYSYLDFLTTKDIQTYSMQLTDNVKEYGLSKDWGRMSLSDRVNGMASVIFSNYGLSVMDYYRTDEVVYSDKAVNEPTSVKPLHIAKKVQCKESTCTIYGKFLNTLKGGTMKVTINALSQEIDTNRDEARYMWKKLGNYSQNGTIEITFDDVKGFQSIADILVIPESTEKQLIANYERNNVILVDRANAKQEKIDDSVLCSSLEKKKNIYGIDAYDIEFSCAAPRYLGFGVWKGSNALYYDKTSKKYSMMDLTKGYKSINGTVYLVTFSSIMLWALLIPTYFGVVLFTLLYRSQKLK